MNQMLPLIEEVSSMATINNVAKSTSFFTLLSSPKAFIRQLILLSFLLFGLGVNVLWGQVSVTNASPSYTQDFNGMGTSSLAPLPTNWKMSGAGFGSSSGWGDAANFTAVSQSANTGSPTAGGRYNWGTSTTERSLGVMTSNGYSSTSGIMSFFSNNGTTAITSLTISYDLERYRINTAAASVLFYYSLNGTTWITVAAGDIATAALPTGTSAYNYTTTGAPSSTNCGVINKSNITISSLNIAPSATFYLKWVLNTSGGNSQGIGIDNVVCTATYSPPTYSLTYNGNGNTSGTAPVDATSPYVSGATVTVLGNTGTLARTGYSFAGWNTLANGLGTDRTAGSTFTISSNTTLFAKWTANSNTITFDGNGSTGGSTASQNINTAASANLTANGFTRTGYTFVGWNTAANGTGTSYANQVSYTMGTSNVTLYAQWSANNITVTFDSQGGSSISNGNTTTGGAFLNPGNPTRSGYTFNGWFVSSTGGSAISFPYSHGQTANFTLFAQWTIVATPTLDPVSLSSYISTTYGTASSGMGFTASGSNLSSNITATAQSGYQVSEDNITFGSSVSVSSGATVYVRFSSIQAAGSYNNATAVVLSSTGATNVNVTTSSSGNTVSPKALTITGISISNKTYDATTTATISGTAAYSGLVNGESFSVIGTPSANFNNKNVGTAKPINISGYTAPSANYSITQPTGLTADVTAKALTVISIAVTSKTYDGNTNATITGTLSGVESGDIVTLTGTGTFASANAGVGINVTSTSTLGGTDAGNYFLTQPTGLTGEITKANQTISFGPLSNKTTVDLPFALNGTASSGLTVSYSSSNPSVATVVGNTVTIVGAGSTIITASQNGNGNFNAAADVAQNLTVTLPDIQEVIFPQYVQGLNGTNSNRIPSAYYLTLNNLNANTTYRFYCGFVTASDLSNSSGAGNNIFVNNAGGSFTRSTLPSLSAAGNYGTLTTNANGSYTGWFVMEPTGNATRFIPGNNLFLRVTLNDGNNGTTATNYRTTTNTTKVINLVASAGANNGTGLYGTSYAGAKNFAVLYDNTNGTGRPVSASFIEDDGSANTSANSYSSFYNANVNSVAGAFGVVIPNNNSNGIKRIEFKKLSDNSLIYAVTDNDANWSGTANTVNPIGGTTAISLPHSMFDDAIFNESAGITLAQNTTVNSTLYLLNGTLNVGANTLTLNGPITRTSGNIDASNALATVVFSGSNAQTVPASTFIGIINKLTLNNGAGLTSNQNLSIANNLNLNNGKLDILGNTLTIGTSSNIGNISGAFGSNSYIVAYDNGSGNLGKVKRFVNSTPNATYTFPIGDDAYYTPITYTNNNGVANAGAFLTVHTKPAKISQLNSAIINYLNRYWEVEPNGISAPDYNVTFSYDNADVVGDPGFYVPVKYSNNEWYIPNSTTFTSGIAQGTASVLGSNTLMWSNLTTFSQFSAAGDQASPLPVELVSFQANCAGDNKINVSWTTASEHNASHYVVEHSRNGNEWTALAMVAASGNSTSLLDYTYVHENANAGTSYYRLTQYDNDGVFEQFNVVSAACDNINSTTTLSTYPNPSEGSFYISLFTEEMEGAGVITITDAIGTLVHTQDVSIQKGNTIFHMDNLNVAPGMYYIQVINGNTSTFSLRQSMK
jgi:uncharacterized repeat protein (TIGR02543 family)